MQCCPRRHLEDLRVWDHGGVGARNVYVTLVELPEPAPGHLGLVPSVHLGNVVPLHVGDGVLSHIASKGHCQIIPAS